MGHIGTINGTPEEQAAYARALGQVLRAGELVRDVQTVNGWTWLDRVIEWMWK